jgi:hypothetical protein
LKRKDVVRQAHHPTTLSPVERAKNLAPYPNPAGASSGRLGGRIEQKALVATFSNVENLAALAARESTQKFLACAAFRQLAESIHYVCANVIRKKVRRELSHLSNVES